MISVEKLYELESISSLYSTHKNMYRDKVFKAFQFNVLLFSKLSTNPKFNTENDDYQPRIYSAEPWSVIVDPASTTLLQPTQRYYRNGRFVQDYYKTAGKSFSTPIHNSLIFKNDKTNWVANIIKSQNECSRLGLRCESLPTARLKPDSITSLINIRFHNRLLLMCQGKYVCQVQGFKSDLAHITANSTHVLAYPCPDDKYTYRFVVRPVYV